MLLYTANGQAHLGPPRTQLLQPGVVTIDTLRNWAWLQSELGFLHLTPHDTVADIGSYDGYYPALYSVFSDSVVFYLGDITGGGFNYLDSLRILSSNLKGRPLTNVFKTVIGTDTSTNLPHHLFSKVILRDALHHFKQPAKMLHDIKHCMKPGASLFLFETIKPVTGTNEKLCAGAMVREDFLNLMKSNHYQLIREQHISGALYWFEFK